MSSNAERIIQLNMYLIRERVVTNAYTSEIAEQLIAAACPSAAAVTVAKLAEANGIPIAAALAKFRRRNPHPSMLAMPAFEGRNNWPPVPGGEGWVEPAAPNTAPGD